MDSDCDSDSYGEDDYCYDDGYYDYALMKMIHIVLTLVISMMTTQSHHPLYMHLFQVVHVSLNPGILILMTIMLGRFLTLY